MQHAITKIPARAWTCAYDGDGRSRDGAWAAELTGLPDLPSWPKGMRVIVRKERPHPGAQLRFTGIDGHRFTAFTTSTRHGQLADLELRHRRRARCENRIRNAKDTGLRNLPLHGYDQNQICCQIVALACELLAWMAMLALTGTARRWEPKRLRLRLLSAAGRIVRGSRLRLRLAAHSPWTRDVTAAISRLQSIAPGQPAGIIPATRKEKPQRPVEPAHPARQPGLSRGPPAQKQRSGRSPGHQPKITKHRG